MTLTDVETLDQYLDRYGHLLAERTQASLFPLHVPGEHEHHPKIAELKRPPIGPQGDVISAMAKALGRQKAVFFAGEMGTGKTIGGMAAVHCHANGRPYRALVWCPGHLLKKWKREILDTIPGAKVTLLQTCADVFALWDERNTEPDRPEWYVIARDRAKLGAKWKAAVVERPKIVEDEGKRKRATALYCPACGKSLIDKDGVLLSLAQLERKRSYCENVVDKEKDARCGAPLWQYVHYAGRFEPAMWIKRRLKGFFRYLIIDEAHEEKGADTAQGNAVGSLVAACDKVIALTGTLIGGFAEHLRPLLFRLAPGTLVDEGLSWKDQTKFVERYGRIETRITTTASESRGGWEDNAQSRGSRRSTTKICRPGIMPTLFGRHLIGNALFLSLEQMSNTLPTLTETVTPVAMDPVLAGNYERLEETLRAEIKALFRAKGPGGCRLILSQMLNALLLYPDHPFGWNEIGYHDNGAWVPVCKPLSLDQTKVWAKEQQLIRLVKNEHWNGRQTWVFTTYNGEKDVQGRIAKLLAQAEPGLVVKELRANVPLAQREEWIAKEGRDAHVIVSHPKLVETGLDLFDKAGRHNFSTLIFYETGYNLFTLRQASRRSWRIGQPLPCKVMYLYYDGTMQAQALAHMGNKLAASLALDGKFSSDGLAAMCDDDSMEMVMAKSLVDNITEDAQGAWEHAKNRERNEPVLLSFEHYKAQLAAGEDSAVNDLLALFGAVEAT